MQKILVIVGTRPNFIKITQFKQEASLRNIDLKIVHTGQHFDDKMADVFFRQFNLIPDYFLNIQSKASANSQIAEIMTGLEHLISTNFRPDLMVVVGDVNSTLAGALTANKLGITLAHVESGLRSYDKTMPEEHNRVITDKLSDLFFVTEQSGYDHLMDEKTDPGAVFFVGNTMIDTMVAFEKEIEASTVLSDMMLEPQRFALITMHRPATVDNKEGLEKIAALLKELSKTYKLVFPAHPRTIKNMEAFGLSKVFGDIKGLMFTEPLDYFAFQKLVKYSKFILTDSGGIQEESTFLKVPCLTLRPNTERPVTCTTGTNTLVPFDIPAVLNYIYSIENGTYKKGSIPKLWDGKASSRIFDVLEHRLK
ncbi:MAG: non-hydrolyzing UDP-N-acetylglucosamine 2-epimerase [Bacteroidia bacterium]